MSLLLTNCGPATPKPADSLTVGARAFWPLAVDAKAANGNTTYDLTVASGAPAFPADYCHFNGATPDGLQAASPLLDPPAGDFTFALWFWVDGTGLATLAGTINAYHTFTRTTDVETRAWNGTGFQTSSKAFTQAANTWYFVRSEYVAATKVLSVDINESGTPGTVVLTTPLVQSGNPAFNLGQNTGGFGNLTGRLKLVGFWDRVWTAGEKTRFYNGGAGFNPFA